MIRVERAGSIVTLILDRPSRRNALDLPAAQLLADHIDEFSVAGNVRCLVIAGAGRTFSAGADLPEGGEDLPGPEMMAAVTRLITGLVGLPLPVIAKVEGAAVGVGASIAFACDLVFASSSSYFSLPFLGLGLVPDGGATLTIASSAGRARAMRLALLGERLSASDAFDAGLIAQVCEPDDLDGRVEAAADALAAVPAAAFAGTKALINANALAGFEAALARESREQVSRLESWEFREGVAAFRERRRPRFDAAPR